MQRRLIQFWCASLALAANDRTPPDLYDLRGSAGRKIWARFGLKTVILRFRFVYLPLDLKHARIRHLVSGTEQ